jgi:hypothetical protein
LFPDQSREQIFTELSDRYAENIVGPAWFLPVRFDGPAYFDMSVYISISKLHVQQIILRQHFVKYHSFKSLIIWLSTVQKKIDTTHTSEATDEHMLQMRRFRSCSVGIHLIDFSPRLKRKKSLNSYFIFILNNTSLTSFEMVGPFNDYECSLGLWVQPSFHCSFWGKNLHFLHNMFMWNK